MIVISDNSALSALAEVGLLDLLPRLFGFIVIPEAVLGIIGQAAEYGWLEFDETIEQIRRTGFHLNESVVEAVRLKIRQ